MIPKMRFSEFEDDYTKETLGSVSKDISYGIGAAAKPYDSKYRYLRITDIDESSFTNLTDGNSVSPNCSQREAKEYILDKGDVVLARTGASVGKMFLNTKYENLVYAGFLIRCKINSKALPYYLTTSLQTQRYNKWVSVMSVRSGQPGINAKEYSRYPLNLPSLQEQKRVSSLFASLDQKINLLTKKKEALETYKKGLMQRIFSQELRFKREDGTDYPEWRKVKIGDVTICKDNKRIPLNQNERNSKKGIFPYYGANGIVDYVDEYLFDEDLVLLAEDGGFFFEFSNKPIAQLVRGKSWVNNHAHVLKAREGIIQTDYLFYSLVHRDIRRWIIGGSRVKLNKSDLLNIKIDIPTLEEQKKISSVLSTAFNQIRTLNRVIGRVEELKKGLLQQMFV